MIKKYNKLIRDRIPEIIREAGEKPFWRVLNKKEYVREIKKKLVEESREMVKAGKREEVIDEIVDVQELIDALAAELRLTKSQIRKRQGIKNKKRGSFRKRLFLIKTTK